MFVASEFQTHGCKYLYDGVLLVTQTNTKSIMFEVGNKLSKGRPLGSKNIRKRELDKACEEADRRGYPHPYLQMAEWANNPNIEMSIRSDMLKACASYRCPKPKESHHVELTVPPLTTIEQAEAFLASLAAETDLEPLELIATIRHWIDSKRSGVELELKQIAAGGTGDAVIRIEGGLPELPGTEIIHPGLHTPHYLNGHAPTPQIESAPSEAPFPKGMTHDRR
jgi:hypothetical protein